MDNLLDNNIAVAISEVGTKLCRLNLHELGDVDKDRSSQGGDDVHQGPVALGLDLVVVVWSAHSKVALYANTHYHIDTPTYAYPATFSSNQVYIVWLLEDISSFFSKKYLVQSQ